MDSLVTITGGSIRADVNQSPPTTNTLPGSISNPENILTDIPHNNSTINTSTHPSDNTPNIISQTQQSHPNPTDVSNISATSSFILTSTNNDEIITAHHEDKVYTLTSHFCLPVNQTPLNDNYVCKFPNRDCVMKRCKIFDGSGSQNLHQLSETVFSPPSKLTGTLKYCVVDSRIIKCCQPACTNGLDRNPKLFHFSCYIHSFLKSDNKGMKIISVTSENDKVLEFLNMPEHVLNEVKSVLRNGTSVTFPCCGKRCYKIVATGKIQKKKVPTSSSTCTSPNITNNTNPNWDKDGSNTMRSSIQILIGWLTTEENATNYFGGLDKDGRTSSDRKESYHNYISEKIHKENGSIRTPDSVCTKIVRILQGYKKAHDHINNTGAGLHGIEFCNYQDKVVNTHCRFYFALNPILGQRPNVKPWYTNEFDDNNEDEENINDCDNESVESTDNNHIDFDVDDEIMNDQRDAPVTIGTKRSQVINLSCSEDDSASITINMTSESSGGQCNVDSSSLSSAGVNRIESSNSQKCVNTSKSGSTATGSPRKSKTKTTKKKVKLSPSAALEVQKSMVRKNIKQIHARNTHSKLSDVLLNEEKERQFIMETRKSKLTLDHKKYDDMKKFEMKKIDIDEKRLNMEEEERDLKREHIKSQTTLEKNKALLVKMEIFKMRQALKKSDPSITDEFLDEQFPY